MRFRVAALSIIVLLLSSDDGCAQPPPGQPPAGVILEVLFEGDSVQVLRAVPSKRRPHAREVRRHRVRPGKWQNYPIGSSEYIVAFYDSLGAPVGRALAIDGPEHVFFDRVTRNGLQGTRARPKRALRHVRVPMRPDVQSLAFFHVQVETRAATGEPFRRGVLSTDGSRALNATLLVQIPMPFRDGFGPPQPPPVPPIPPLPPLPPIPEIKLPPEVHPLNGVFDRKVRRVPINSGGFNDDDEEEILHKYGICSGDAEDTATRYDIVILGDGFADTESDEIEWTKYATALCERIQATPPFSTAHADGQLDIHFIRTFSEESGITDCTVYADRLAAGVSRCALRDGDPDDAEFPVATYFESYGYAPDPSVPGQTTDPAFIALDQSRILAATSWKLPIDEVELYVVIANCKAGGGSSPAPGIAVVTLPENNDLTSFLDIAIHEMGHAVANLAEEYTSCYSWQEAFLDSFPNVVHASQAGDVWWSLLPGAMLNADGDLALQHLYASPTGNDGATIHGCTFPECGNAHNSETFTVADNYAGVGMYWSGAFIEVPEGGEHTCYTGEGCDQQAHFDRWSEPMAKNVYRPSAMCRMRSESYPFCGICMRAVGEALFHPTPVPIP